MSIVCKDCESSKYIKNGFVQGVQRYRCKQCGCNFVEGDKRIKYGSHDHLKVIKLYLENCGIRSIERITGIRNSQISKWIENTAAYIRKQLKMSQHQVKTIQDIEIMELDELCTFVKKDQRTEENTSSYGLLLIDQQIKLLILK
jgi:transposase-like protein